MLPTLNVRFSGIKYIYNVVQLPLFISRTFLLSQKETLYQLITPYSPLLLAPGNLYSTLSFYEFDYDISRIVQYLSFDVWLILLSMFLGFIYVACTRISFLKAE